MMEGGRSLPEEVKERGGKVEKILATIAIIPQRIQNLSGTLMLRIVIPILKNSLQNEKIRGSTMRWMWGEKVKKEPVEFVQRKRPVILMRNRVKYSFEMDIEAPANVDLLGGLRDTKITFDTPSLMDIKETRMVLCQLMPGDEVGAIDLIDPVD